MEIRRNALSAETFLELFRAAGWDPPCAEQVQRALSNTYASFLACEDGRPVGMVRLLGDGGMSFYLKDFAVLPDCRGKGVGAALLGAAEAYILEQMPAGWKVSLELISTPGAVGFYKKHGFEERPCDWDGPGMFKMLG